MIRSSACPLWRADQPGNAGEQAASYTTRWDTIGILQVDGYAGYRALADRNAVSLAFCWSHVRRKFYELAQSGPAPIATEALQRIAELYKIESDIRGRPADERRAARQQRSRPIIDALDLWLRGKLALVSQKSKLAEAIRYALSRWTGLTRFLDEGRVEIDSNVVERTIRPIALNRKNALFAGSDGGGEHWATIDRACVAWYSSWSSFMVKTILQGGPVQWGSIKSVFRPWDRRPSPLQCGGPPVLA